MLEPLDVLRTEKSERKKQYTFQLRIEFPVLGHLHPNEGIFYISSKN